MVEKTTLRVALFLLLSLSVNGQTPAWEAMKTQKVFTFDLDCAEKRAFPKQALGRIVQQAIPAKDRGKPDNTYGDLAVATKLRTQGPTVYFVPTVCDTGNCTWLLYTINPVKSMAEIKAEAIYSYQSSMEMPTIVSLRSIEMPRNSARRIVSYSTYSYAPESGKYKWLGDDYRIEWEAASDMPVERLPIFIKNAKHLLPQCKE